MPKFGRESEVIDRLKRLDEESGQAKKGFKERIKENLGQFRGDSQWRLSRDPYFQYNLIEENIEAKVGKLSESRPRIRVMPILSGLAAPANILEKTISSFWADRGVEGKLERCGYFGAIMGASFVSVPFNPHLNFGEGDIDFVVRDPRTVRFDPTVKDPADLSERAEYVILDDIMPLDLIRAAYPGRGTLIEPDPRLVAYEEVDHSALGRIKSAAQRLLNRGGAEKSLAVDRCLVSEFWLKDRRRSAEDPGPLPLIEGLTQFQPKGTPFPGGRKVLVAFGRAGPIVLEDTFNRYWDGMFPIDMISWKIDVETAWGPDEIKGLKKIQEAINRSGDAYVGNLLKNAIIRLMVDRGAMDPAELRKFANDAAEILYKNPGRSVEYKVPEPLPGEVLNLLNRLIELGKQKSGVVDFGLQKRMPSIVTGPALEGLQLSGETPIRSSARRMEEFLERIGQKLISRIFQFYTSDRILHYVSTLQEWQEFEFKRSQLIAVRTKTGGFRPREPEEIQKAYRDFRFKVEPGSSLAITKMQRGLMKAEFAKVGAMRWSKVMEELGIDNAEEEVKEAQREIQSGEFVPQQDGRKKSAVQGAPSGS